jgi:N-acetyl-anhydromuramyl-L-alanine amidase AmpD
MTVDSFQTIINKQEQDRIAKAQKLRKQIEASQRKIEIESTPSYKYPEVMVEGMPNIRTTKSQSFIQGSPLKNEVKKVVLHHTGSTDEKNNNKYVYNHFMNPNSETSAHIVIEEDGQRTIYASPDQVTFHAGKSSWDGRSNVNDFGIGVEFQGDTNVKPLTSAQIKSFVEYFDQLAKKYNVSTEDIITHAMVAPGRKPDITESQYKRILKYLKERGYE